MSILPERIGPYSVVREIGAGATARVLLGHDNFADRSVALKVFRPSAEGGVALKGADRVAFLNEAKLVGKLHHPHIVGILDAATDADYWYIVMEFVPGATLAHYSSADRLLAVPKVIEVAFKVSGALEYAHRQGVVHRDIKPSNVLVTDGLDVKLSDFGIAIVRDATHTHLMNAGTPAYVAPELLSGRQPTEQSDIYSLGVLMYQLLTGRLPFNASSHASLMYQIMNHDAPPPRMLRPELWPELEAIVVRTLLKDPRDRYASWLAFSLELARLAEVLEPPRQTVSEARRFGRLRGLSFFAGFTDVEVWEALRITQWHSFPAQTKIIGEGERGDSFYLLVEGSVEVTRAGRHLATLRPGDCFGEMLYFSSNTTHRTITIRSRDAVLVAEIKAAALSAASDHCQVQFNKAFMTILIDRLSAANKRLAER